MSLLLIIGNKNYSSWSLRPWLLLAHFGVAFDERRLTLDTDAFYAEIPHWSPSRTVPALHHDGLVVWDSLAICEYVSEAFLDGRGWPADPRLRAQARSAAAEMHAGFAALRAQLPMNCRRTPNAYRWDAEAQRDIDRVQALWRDLRAAHGHGGDFLCGGFGIVDAMFAPVAVRFRGYGVDMDDGARAFVDAIHALPAFARWPTEALAETERVPSIDAYA
jgi:glutathione S-transferase